MRTRVLGTLTLVALLVAVAAPSQATVLPALATSADRVGPSAVSPRIGYVYGAGLADSGGGITVYAQQANGALTRLQDVLDGDAVHSTVLVHLRSGMALYDLTRHGLYAFRVNPVTGLLTPFSVPAPTSPVSAVNGLAAYDPLAHGLPGQPLLVTGACGVATLTFVCPFRFQTFRVNPVTGALAVSQVGPVSTTQVVTGLTGDGRGRFAVGLRQSDYSTEIAFAKASVVGGTTGLVGVGGRTIADNAVGQKPVGQSMGSAILITPSGLVEFPAGPLQAVVGHPGGWVAYGFGSMKAAPYESRVDAEVTAAAVGRRVVFVGEDGGNLPAGRCALEAFGLGAPGLGGIRTLFPCSGSPAFVTSMFEQGTYLYVARYQEHSLGFHDVGAASVVPTAQGAVPSGVQIYSWAGFLFGDPTVAVPAAVSMHVGVPVTIGCQQTCSGSVSATITIAGSTSALHIAALVVTPHAAGVFTVKLLVPTALRGAILLAIRRHHAVTVTTRTRVTAGVHAVTIARVSTMVA